MTPTRTPTNTPTLTPTAAASSSTTITPTPAPNENSGGDQFCHDGFDNDFDGLIDCADPDCARVNPCGSPVPTASPTGTLLLTAVLAFVGLAGLARLRWSK